MQPLPWSHTGQPQAWNKKILHLKANYNSRFDWVHPKPAALSAGTVTGVLIYIVTQV